MCKNTRQNAASKTHLQGIDILQAWSRAFFQAYCNSLSSCKISTNEFVQFNFFYIQHLNALTVKIFKIHSVIQDRTLSLNGYARAILSCMFIKNKAFTQLFNTSAEERSDCKSCYQTLQETREVFILINFFFIMFFPIYEFNNKPGILNYAI